MDEEGHMCEICDHSPCIPDKLWCQDCDATAMLCPHCEDPHDKKFMFKCFLCATEMCEGCTRYDSLDYHCPYGEGPDDGLCGKCFGQVISDLKVRIKLNM